MKMLKKIMAVLLVSVLALTVLTGCGASFLDENELLKMMNDSVKIQSLNVTIKADSSVKSKAQAVAKIAAKAKNSAELETLLASDEVEKTLLNNDANGIYMVSYIKNQNFASKYYQSQKEYVMLDQMADHAVYVWDETKPTPASSNTELAGFANVNLSDGAYAIVVMKIA